ncbi:MAG: antitoxin [Spirochaetes bacterium]|jgi:predicted DNA binding CopG/RHH family protein|nr:antitoxin [Spirochaetota bacterium]
MSKYDLTTEEQKIEEHADELVSVSGEERAEVESIIEHARKNRPVNLRMSEFDLELIKKRAQAEGLPYQTLINRIVHKYVTDQMLDREEVRKVIAEARDMKAI